jgi:ABC-type transporter Mla subunit MlaD
VEADAKYAWVGAAIVALVAALVFGVVWLKQVGTADRYRTYTIYFERLALNGLSTGASVEMRGIKVGSVDDYAIQSSNINRVQVTIRVDRRTPVSQTTVAMVDRNYVTGIARINLETPGAPGPPLVAVSPGERYPVIPEGSSTLGDVASTLKGLGEQSAEVMQSLNESLNEKNRAAFTATLANAATLTAGLNTLIARLESSVVAFDASIAQVGRAGQVLARSTEQFNTALQPTVVQARATLEDASRAMASIERDTAALTRRLGNAADATSDQVTVTAIELRRSVAVIARTLEGMENLRGALIGPNDRQFGPGERLQ